MDCIDKGNRGCLAEQIAHRRIRLTQHFG
jgi:hypothetical protein